MDSTRIALLLFLSTINRATTDEINLSGKPVSQSGTYSGMSAGLANDGSTTTCCVACTTCDPSYTGNKTFAWWQVDLGASYTLTSVTLTNNPASYDAGYLQNFIIYVGPNNDVDGSNSQICYFFNNGSSVPPSQTISIGCNSNSIGRYLTVKRQGGFRPDALSLCDVHVFGSLTSNSQTCPNSTLPTLDHGFIVSFSYQLGGTYVVYQCLDGYRFSSPTEGILWCNSSTGGWYGSLSSCQVNTDPCQPNPCLNQGLCSISENPFGFGYFCFCPEPFAGRHCQKYNPCQTSPCPGNAISCWRTFADDSGRFCYDSQWNLVT